MRARLALPIAVAAVLLGLAAQALGEPSTNPPVRNLPANTGFTAGTDITFQATTTAASPTAPAPTDMDFYISRSPDTNARGALFKEVDVVAGALISGTPATATVHRASWSGVQPGRHYWQAVYLDCFQDTDCVNQSSTGTFTVNPLPAAAVKSSAQVDTFLDHHPRHRTRKRKVRFDFSSNVAGASFKCLFAQGWADCTSPHVFRRLKPGRYKFQARAVVNELEDQSPVSWTFRVLRKRR